MFESHQYILLGGGGGIFSADIGPKSDRLFLYRPLCVTDKNFVIAPFC